jgi:hypothetical protein
MVKVFIKIFIKVILMYEQPSIILPGHEDKYFIWLKEKHQFPNYNNRYHKIFLCFSWFFSGLPCVN